MPSGQPSVKTRPHHITGHLVTIDRPTSCRHQMLYWPEISSGVPLRWKATPDVKTLVSLRTRSHRLRHRKERHPMTNLSHARLLIFGILLLPVGPTAAMSAQDTNLVLVEAAKPRASILLSQKPTASAQLAAFELQFYLEKISGGRLPIVREPTRVKGTVILVGESRRSRALGFHHKDFSRQEYVVQTHRDGLLLMGHDGQEFTPVQYDSYTSLYAAGSHPIGTCYAVHSFPEHQLGIKWYLPNESLGEVVPKHRNIPLHQCK